MVAILVIPVTILSMVKISKENYPIKNVSNSDKKS